jgi:hypothetical protein
VPSSCEQDMVLIDWRGGFFGTKLNLKFLLNLCPIAFYHHTKSLCETCQEMSWE